MTAKILLVWDFKLPRRAPTMYSFFSIMHINLNTRLEPRILIRLFTNFCYFNQPLWLQVKDLKWERILIWKSIYENRTCYLIQLGFGRRESNNGNSLRARGGMETLSRTMVHVYMLSNNTTELVLRQDSSQNCEFHLTKNRPFSCPFFHWIIQNMWCESWYDETLNSKNYMMQEHRWHIEGMFTRHICTVNWYSNLQIRLPCKVIVEKFIFIGYV